MPPRLPLGGGAGCQALRVSSRSRASAPALLVSSVVAGFLLAGCTGNEDGSGRPAASRSAADTPAESTPAGQSGGEGTAEDGATDAPPFPADVEPDSAEASAGGSVTVSDIRIGRHDGFDRVVFETGGEGLPGWDVRYVDEALSQGSGDPVAVAGDAVLQVTVTGVGYPADTGVEEFSGRDPLRIADTEVVTEVVFDSTFEGTTVAFVGTSHRRPFRVYLLEEPTRVVLEVAHTG
jgi:hypothetical protein